jgi:ribosomal 50S subunit-recycling heat shock protein
MRLDKFLKNSRLIKRRTLAKEMCEAGRIEIGGHKAKAGSKVSVGDEIRIRYGQKRLTVRVDALLDSPRKEDAEKLYTMLAEEPVQYEQDDPF